MQVPVARFVKRHGDGDHGTGRDGDHGTGRDDDGVAQGAVEAATAHIDHLKMMAVQVHRVHLRHDFGRRAESEVVQHRRGFGVVASASTVTMGAASRVCAVRPCVPGVSSKS